MTASTQSQILRDADSVWLYGTDPAFSQQDYDRALIEVIDECLRAGVSPIRDSRVAKLLNVLNATVGGAA